MKESIDMVYHEKSIQLEEIPEYVQKWERYFLEKYKMKDSIAPKILTRNTTNEHDTFPSDNYIYEYLINEKLLGFIYCRRNEFNNCEFIVTDLEREIPITCYK